MSVTNILIGLIVYNIISIAINLSQMVDHVKSFKSIRNDIEREVAKKQYRKALFVLVIGMVVVVIQTWLLVYCVNKLA